MYAVSWPVWSTAFLLHVWCSLLHYCKLKILSMWDLYVQWNAILLSRLHHSWTTEESKKDTGKQNSFALFFTCPCAWCMWVSHKLIILLWLFWFIFFRACFFYSIFQDLFQAALKGKIVLLGTIVGAHALFMTGILASTIHAGIDTVIQVPRHSDCLVWAKWLPSESLRNP